MAKIIKNKLGNFLVICLIFLTVTVWIFSGWPQIWKNPPFPPKIQEVHAATTLNNFVGFETGGLEEAIATTGTPPAQEVVVRTGDYSLLARTEQADRFDIRIITGGSSDAGNKYVVGFAVQFEDLDPGIFEAIFFEAYDSIGRCFLLKVDNSDGDIEAYDAGAGLIGSSASALSTATWHFIEVLWEHSDAGSIDVYVDGNSKISSASEDLSAGGSIDDDAAVYRLRGQLLSYDTFFDDFYCMSGASGTGDFLGDAEVFRYQANTASVTPDSGDDLDDGDSPYYWQQVGRTPSDASAAGYSAPVLTGYVFTDDAEDGKHYRHGPHGDANIDGTIKGAKWIWVLDSESATDHHVNYGNDSPSVTADLQSMVAAYTSYFRVKDAAADECPTVAEHFAIGFGTVGKKGLLGKEMWAMLLHVPAEGPTTTIANGTDPGNSTVAPGTAITDLDAFTLITDSGSDSVTAATVTLTPAGAYNNIAQVDITDTSDVAQCTAVTGLTSNTVSFPASTCSIPVTTTETTYKVRITPKTHANMPPVPGASYDTTGTVTAFTSTNNQSGSDGGSATITIDNLSPNNATSTSGSVTSDTSITINWTTSNSTDYNRSIVLRWQNATPGADVPVEGTDYNLDDTINGATVACVENTGTSSTAYSGVDGSGADECSTTALTIGTQYSYKHFEKDDNGNWNAGFTNASSPLTTTGGATLTFSISDNDIFFGDLSASASKWADNTADGSTTAVVAHTLTASTNATNGYTITVNGTTLTSSGDTITAMASEDTLTTGQEEFGLRITASGGNGTVDADYDNDPDDSYALITDNFPDVIATDADGDDVSTTYSLYYAANIAANTEAHTDYTSALTYVVTGNF